MEVKIMFIPMAEVPMIVNDKLETRMLVWDTISHQSMGKINTNEKIEIYKPYHSLFGYLFNDLSKATNQKDRCIHLQAFSFIPQGFVTSFIKHFSTIVEASIKVVNEDRIKHKYNLAQLHSIDLVPGSSDVDKRAAEALNPETGKFHYYDITCSDIMSIHMDFIDPPQNDAEEVNVDIPSFGLYHAICQLQIHISEEWFTRKSDATLMTTVPAACEPEIALEKLKRICNYITAFIIETRMEVETGEKDVVALGTEIPVKYLFTKSELISLKMIEEATLMAVNTEISFVNEP